MELVTTEASSIRALGPVVWRSTLPQIPRVQTG